MPHECLTCPDVTNCLYEINVRRQNKDVKHFLNHLLRLYNTSDVCIVFLNHIVFKLFYFDKC